MSHEPPSGNPSLSASPGSAAYLAVQYSVGILSKRRAGSLDDRSASGPANAKTRTLAPLIELGVSSDEIVKQLQQIVNTLQQIVQASAGLSDRVEALEQQSGEKVGVFTSLQAHLQVLLETYQKQVTAQDMTNRTVLEGIANLEARLAALESAGEVLRPENNRPN